MNAAERANSPRKPAHEAQRACKRVTEGSERLRETRLDPVARAETFPTSRTRWKWPQFQALSNLEDPATRKSALTVWVGRIIEDWDGLKNQMANFWSATGRKDAAEQLETAAEDFPDVVKPLSEKIETHNAALEAEAEAERIRKAKLARKQSRGRGF